MRGEQRISLVVSSCWKRNSILLLPPTPMLTNLLLILLAVPSVFYSGKPEVSPGTYFDVVGGGKVKLNKAVQDCLGKGE